MGAFEDFVNANLGIRKPIITDAGIPSLSSKAAGIIGSQYIDSDTQFLYEKTGEDNSSDWVKIAYIGQTRGQPPEGVEGSVQFKSGDFFAGSPNLTYDHSAGLLSGQSGDFNYIYTNFITGETGHFGQEVAIGDPAQDDVFVVDDGNIETAGRANFSGPISGPSIATTTGFFEKLIVSGDAYVSGDFYVSGTTYINDIIDTTVSGTISGYTGVFNTTSGRNGSFTDSLTISGISVLTGVEVAGGGQVVAGDEENINFGGTEATDVRDINFQQGGDNVMVINQEGDIDVQNNLDVSGNISGSTGYFDEIIINGTNIQDSLKNYPVVTGGEFNSATNILSLFRDLSAASIEIDLSSLAGGGSTFQSTLLWEENNGDLVLLEDETTTSYPATQLFENSGDNSYTVREDVFGSNTEAAQYFEETGVDITLTTSSYLPPIPPVPAAVSTQWFEEDGSDQLLMRDASLATSNPAVQLWEPTGVDQYTPRPEPFNSTTESAQYFQETGIDQLTTT